MCACFSVQHISYLRLQSRSCSQAVRIPALAVGKRNATDLIPVQPGQQLHYTGLLNCNSNINCQLLDNPTVTTVQPLGGIQSNRAARGRSSVFVIRRKPGEIRYTLTRPFSTVTHSSLRESFNPRRCLVVPQTPALDQSLSPQPLGSATLRHPSIYFHPPRSTIDERSRPLSAGKLTTTYTIGCLIFVAHVHNSQDASATTQSFCKHDHQHHDP